MKIFILEEESLNSAGLPYTCITQRLKNGGDLFNYREIYEQFVDEKDFQSKLFKIVAHMLKSNHDNINLLIISAHGIGNTGTNLWTSNNSINLRNYQEYFRVLPKHMVVYMRSCESAFPGTFWAFYEKSDNKPLLVGPIVPIGASDANVLEEIIIETIRDSSDNENILHDKIIAHNSLLQNKYGKQYSIGMFFRSGIWYPEVGILY
ncbi:MAG TPA: hypothetical protein PLD91_19115 [Spirochaetota bacterium]|nr:hypothetical protein [Spirochaetota bacterium]